MAYNGNEVGDQTRRAHTGDDYGNPIRQTDEYGNPIHHTGHTMGEYGAPVNTGTAAYAGTAATTKGYETVVATGGYGIQTHGGTETGTTGGYGAHVGTGTTGGETHSKEGYGTHGGTHGGHEGGICHEERGFMDKIKDCLPGNH